MRLLVITNLFFPDRGGGASVFSDLCFGLAEKGWEVSVLTTHPYYPEWRRKSNDLKWSVACQIIAGVRVWRHGIFIPKSPSKLLPRILFEVSFAASLLRSVLRGGRFDRVMVYCPMFGSVLFAALRKALLREPLWLNVQDIPADAAAASGISRSGVFNLFAFGMQTFLFNRSDVWSTISPVMMKRLSEIRRRSQPLYLCPNWLNGSLAASIAALPSKVGREPGSPLRLLYGGNVGKKQALLDFCRELASFPMNFVFHIHASGGEVNSLKSWIANSMDPRFIFGEFLDEINFTRALHWTDLFVITERGGSGASFLPSKLIPAIATGTPILAVCDSSGPLGSELTEADLGMVFEWSEIKRLAEALGGLATNTAKFVQWQKNCLAHSVHYRREYSLDRFDTLLSDMARK